MILRIFRGRVAEGERDRIVAHLRDVIYPMVARVDGLHSFQAGLRALPAGGDEFAIVSTWSGFDSIVAALGQRLERPRWMTDVEDVYQPSSSEHYELVGAELRGFFPLEGALLRVFRGTLRPGSSEEFFEFARRRQADLLDSGHLLASHLGRRVEGRREEVVYVVLWRDLASLRDLGGAPDEPAARAEWEDYFEDWSFDGYDALTRVSAHGSSDPAVLLADDDRRYVFATPAAGRIVERPVARLLGLRVEDITAPDRRSSVPDMWEAFLRAGRAEGPFELVDGSGRVRRVGYAARANTPWPGCHASLLVPDGNPTAGDIDPALTRAGIVARYASSAG